MDNPTLFDQKIRDAINKYEVPFDDTAWKNIQNQINVEKVSPLRNWKNWILAGTAAALIAVAYFSFDQKESATDLPQNEKSITIEPLESVDEEKQSETVVEENSKIESTQSNDAQSLPLIIQDDKIEEAISSDLKEDAPLEINELQSKENVSGIVASDVEQTKDEQKENPAESLTVNIQLNSQTICSNEALIVSLGSSSAPVEVTWDFGDGITADGPSAMHVYKEAGNYQLSYSARSVLNEELVNRETYMIRVNPKPLAQFEMKMAENMAAYPKVEFRSQSEDVSSLEWIFNDENIENRALVEKMYAKKGSYSVGMIVRNHFLCSDTAFTHFIIENDYNLLAPNAFSPNGDGINDTFIPQAIPYLNQEFTLQVFDPKNGQMIFESSNFELPWNGRFMNNGNRLSDGAYAWSVILEDGSVYKGTILITTK